MIAFTMMMMMMMMMVCNLYASLLDHFWMPKGSCQRYYPMLGDLVRDAGKDLMKLANYHYR